MNEHYIKGKSWAHSRAAWDAVVKPSAATQIAVMGHSAGGSCLISVLQDDENARERVKAMVFRSVGPPAAHPTHFSFNFSLGTLEISDVPLEISCTALMVCGAAIVMNWKEILRQIKS